MEDRASFSNAENSEQSEGSELSIMVSIILIPKLEKDTTIKENHRGFPVARWSRMHLPVQEIPV